MHLPLQRTGDSLSHPVQGDHAVVLGASMSGLLAARVLADHFAQVTVVERDRLATDGRPRKGVPQARHAHALLSRGSEIIEGLFPGFLGDLVAVGVPVGESLDQFHYEVGGHVFFHERGAHVVRQGEGEGEQRMYQPSRPFLEGAVLRRVRALPNVDVLDGYDVEALTTNRAKTRVTGARIVPRDAAAPGPRDVAADLVVAATGRSGRAAAWLKGMGYATPPEDEVEVDLKYVSQRVRFPAGSVDHLRALLVGPTSRRPAGAGALEQEDNHWIVTLYGYGADHHPPLDREAWLAFGDTLLPSDFADALHESQPLEDAHQHRFAANLRRHYEKLGRFPEGFLVTGDALCSVNPVYGQGMTLAGLEVLALRGALRGGWDRLAPRFFGSAAKPIGTAWSFAVGGDLSLPSETVRGPRPVPVRAVNSYVDHFQAAAENDPVMAWRFLDVVGFEQPPAALFAPDSLRRLAADSRHHRRTGSASELAMAAAKGWTWP